MEVIKHSSGVERFFPPKEKFIVGNTALENEKPDKQCELFDTEYDNRLLEKIISDLNKKLGMLGRELCCSIHKKTGRILVKIVESETGKVIREIPPEKSLDILAKVLERSGLLMDEGI
jgi:flagellar protein FlaG